MGLRVRIVCEFDLYVRVCELDLYVRCQGVWDERFRNKNKDKTRGRAKEGDKTYLGIFVHVDEVQTACFGGVEGAGAGGDVTCELWWALVNEVGVSELLVRGVRRLDDGERYG